MKFTKWNQGWMFWDDRMPDKKQKVWLPHDAMLTEKRLKDVKNGVTMGFFPGGKYHYQKVLFGEPEYAAQTVMLEFEGVYMKSSVLLNGERVGGRIYGYSTFFVDLTGKLKIGEDNVIEVIADNTQTPNSRWYSGSGIYRDVYLARAPGKAYIVPNETKLVTVSLDPPTVHVEAVLSAGAGTCDARVEFYKDGVLKGEAKAERENRCLACCDVIVEDARLWSAETPELYDVKIVLEQDGEVLDEVKTRTGIRLLDWNARQGMCVNGKTVKLRGGCVHHDHGPLGAVSLYAAELRRAKILKENGYNAVRYAHNPAGKAFLDACDEAGLYVMVEAFDQWEGKQSDYDYGIYFQKEWKKDLTSMIQVAVNHPSVVIYSYGNEISDVGMPRGAEISKMLNAHCHQLDDSRPTLNAINPVVAAMGSISKSKTTPDDVVDPYEEAKGSQAAGSLLANIIVTVVPIISKVMGKPKKVEKLLKPCFDEMDIVGYNYAEQCYEPHHEWNPKRVMVGSETYPPALAKNWRLIENSPYVIGDFQWTAWDYLGEAGIGVPIYGTTRGGFNRPYPCVSAGCGAIDMTGHAQVPARYSAVIWGQCRKPCIAMRPVDHDGEKYFFGNWRGTDAVESFSWPGMEGKRAEIEVNAIGSQVELWQDGKSLGKKALTDCRAFFETTYRPGELRAVNYDENGVKIEEGVLRSAGKVTHLTVRPERNEIFADGEDLLYVSVEVTDGEGICKMLSERRIKVEVEGAGTLAAIGSGNPYTTDSFLGNVYDTWQGRMIFVVRSNGLAGEIKMKVRAEGLEEKIMFARAK